jgi:hypothetical protein
MRDWVRSSAITRFAGAITAAWLCGMGAAWAGTSGSDAFTQGVLDSVCNAVDISTESCPQVPTVTQAILQISGLENAAPDFVRSPQGNFLKFGGLCSVSSGTSLPVCSQANAINAVNPPAASPVDVSDLPNLTALAFTTGKDPAVPVPLGTSGATSFLYAVATPSDLNGQIKTLTLFFDSTAQTNSNFQKGQVFAQVSLPLALLSGSTERPICGATGCPASVATLQISGCSSGAGCVNGLAANVIGDFSMPGTIGTMSASQLNIGVSVSFAPSPNSASSHLILKVVVPLLVTAATDPAYFGVVPPSGVVPVNQLSGLPTAFTGDVVQKPSNIGIAPQAAPTCAGNNPCPAHQPTTTYPICASFAGGVSGPLGSGSFHSAVATFAAIGTDATAYVSSPVAATLVGSALQCPF